MQNTMAVFENFKIRRHYDEKLEGSELSEKIGQLKMQSTDNKYYLTDIANTEVMLRIIQSIP